MDKDKLLFVHREYHIAWECFMFIMLSGVLCIHFYYNIRVYNFKELQSFKLQFAFKLQYLKIYSCFNVFP